MDEDCEDLGHDTEQLVNGAGEIVLLRCARCGARWRVEPE